MLQDAPTLLDGGCILLRAEQSEANRAGPLSPAFHPPRGPYVPLSKGDLCAIASQQWWSRSERRRTLEHFALLAPSDGHDELSPIYGVV
jgi:hypothetical protein